MTHAHRAAAGSPFRVGFGKTPPVLGDRQATIEEFADAIGAADWDQSRVMILTGLRGVGKTVTLNALEEVGRRQGWAVVRETGEPGVAERLRDIRLPRELARIDPPARTRLKGVTVAPVGGVELEQVDGRQIDGDLRDVLESLIDAKERAGAGVLLTIDEIAAASVADLRELASAVQLAVRDERSVPLAMTGLHGDVDELLAAAHTTFLRRARIVPLGFLSLAETVRALREPVEIAGRALDDDALDYMVAASRGYPYLIQLLGDLAWKTAPARRAISIEDARSALRRALRRMGASVYEPSMRGLSPVDKSVLLAMARDDGPSKIGDIAERLGVESKYVSVYRQRLLDAEMIRQTKYGFIDFTMPYLREYLRDHPATRAADLVGSGADEFPPAPKLD